MKETKTAFTIEETDNFNCIHFGTHKKATNGDRCPKCKSTCLVVTNLTHQLQGTCAKLGNRGKRDCFKPNLDKIYSD